MPKEAHFKYRKRAKEVHPSESAIQAEKKGTSSVALQVPFWATWVTTGQTEVNSRRTSFIRHGTIIIFRVQD